MIVDLGTSLDRVGDLRHRVRRLTWFTESFHTVAADIAARYGLAYSINDRNLANAFLDWAETFTRERQRGEIDPADFTVYSGGLMLKQLLQAAPITRTQPRPPGGGDVVPEAIAKIIEFWPEGFLCVSYCLTIVSSILERDFGQSVGVAPIFGDLRAWESFRENVAEDPSLAMPFFDLLLGRRPNWIFPESLLLRSSCSEKPSIGIYTKE